MSIILDLVLSAKIDVYKRQPLVLPQIQNVYGANVNLAASTLTTESWGKKISEMTPEELNYSGAKLRNYAKDDISDFFETGAT